MVFKYVLQYCHCAQIVISSYLHKVNTYLWGFYSMTKKVLQLCSSSQPSIAYLNLFLNSLHLSSFFSFYLLILLSAFALFLTSRITLRISIWSCLSTLSTVTTFAFSNVFQIALFTKNVVYLPAPFSIHLSPYVVQSFGMINDHCPSPLFLSSTCPLKSAQFTTLSSLGNTFYDFIKLAENNHHTLNFQPHSHDPVWLPSHLYKILYILVLQDKTYPICLFIQTMIV